MGFYKYVPGDELLYVQCWSNILKSLYIIIIIFF